MLNRMQQPRTVLNYRKLKQIFSACHFIFLQIDTKTVESQNSTLTK